MTVLAAPPKGSPPLEPPPVSRGAAAELHRELEALEDAADFGAATHARLRQLLEHLVEMQALAEQAADGSSEEAADPEVACAKIQLLAERYDALARKPVFQDVPVAEGGRFRFELPEPLEVEVPNLRARGEGSLELFEHVDAMHVAIGQGGPVLAGQDVPLPEADPDDPLSEDREPARMLPEGNYRVEVSYLAMDASLVRLSLLPLDGDTPILIREGLDLSADGEGVEVDLGVGLALVLERVARVAEIDIGTTTSQVVEWRHEVGERLVSVEGWFHETVQPRDFELYALHLEGPLGTLRDTMDALEALDERVQRALEEVAERLAPEPAAPESLLTHLAPGAEGWAVLDDESLKDALAEELR